MKKFTPGPWTFGYSTIIGADQSIVASVNRPIGGNLATENANAHLMAAAPELLAALQALVDAARVFSDGMPPPELSAEHSRLYNAVNNAREVIHKATKG